MTETDNHSPGLSSLAGRFSRTAIGLLRNRSELLVVEWQEEKARVLEVLVLGVGLLFLGIMGALMLTATVIFLFRPELRVYVAAGVAGVFLIWGAIVWVSVGKAMKDQ